MEYRGHVKWFNDGKGWGFVTGNDGRDYFVHQRDVLSGGRKVLREGEPVVFELEKKGSKVRAVYVRRVAKEAMSSWPLKGYLGRIRWVREPRARRT